MRAASWSTLGLIGSSVEIKDSFLGIQKVGGLKTTNTSDSYSVEGVSRPLPGSPVPSAPGCTHKL